MILFVVVELSVYKAFTKYMLFEKLDTSIIPLVPKSSVWKTILPYSETIEIQV